jgi:HSP20 family protein
VPAARPDVGRVTQPISPINAKEYIMIANGSVLLPVLQQVRQMERDFDRFFGATGAPSANWTPAVDIRETEAAYTLQVDLPGVKPEAVQLDLNRSVLTIKGGREAVTVDGEKTLWQRSERAFGSFVRQVTLPNHVDANRITAALDHGVLTVTVPKAESAKPRQIPVAVGSAGS